MIAERHGGPYDRGAADSWFRRPRNPHYYKGATECTPIVHKDDMTTEEIAAYNKGFDENEGSHCCEVW